jgi:hypothetical protein
LNIIKIKLPKNPEVFFRHTTKRNVWVKFYGWLRRELKVKADFPLDVSNIHASKEFNKILEKLVSSNLISQVPIPQGRRLEMAVGMEMLNYSPSNQLSPPSDEIWVETEN